MGQKLRSERDKKVETELNSFLLDLQKKYKLSHGQVKQLLKKTQENIDDIPICILNNRKLSSLQAITKYMRENLKLRYSEIADVLNRNPGTIGITYRAARRKLSSKFVITPSLRIPVLIFRDRRLSVLENIVYYLKNKGLSHHKIAVLLNRDDRTIWTVDYRAKLKSKSKKKRR